MIPNDPPNFVTTGGGPDEFERALNEAKLRRDLPPLPPTQPPMKDITPKDPVPEDTFTDTEYVIPGVMRIEDARTMIAGINEMIKKLNEYTSSDQLSTAGIKLDEARQSLYKFINA